MDVHHVEERSRTGSATAVRAALRAYRELRRHGECRPAALRAARLVFGYHEPHLSDAIAGTIVQDLVAQHGPAERILAAGA